MSKPKFETPNLTAENVAKIAELFPGVVTEGKVNFDLLRSMLGEEVFGDEAYEFTWVGKRAAIAEAGRPIRKTLRPCVEESKDWDTTENLYIEGDNLDVLKLLQESYLGKVKMIYIDPPYNTGNDFIYRDNFSQSREEYDEEAGAFDENGERLFKNMETNGQFHSDWCSMMYPRLVLARNMLRDDGVIFISIDDNEQNNLKKICDEIFGQDNFIGNISVIVKPEGRRYGFFAKTHEYVLVYSKKYQQTELYDIEVEGASYQYYDEVGGFNLKGLRNRNVQAFNSANRPNLRYPFYVQIDNPDKDGLCSVSTQELPGYCKVMPSTVNGLESVWRWGKEKSTVQIKDLLAYKGNDGEIRVFQKERKLTQTAKTVWQSKEIISNKGTKELTELLGKGIFDFPKPLELGRTIAHIGSTDNDIILDFFSGSATTAHAVMQLNAQDGGNRKFIMVQLPEVTDEKSEAFKAGYKNICEIGKERIRRAGDKIKAEAGLTAQNLDIGFRVLKLDDTNMNDVYYAAGDYTQDLIMQMESNIKPDRTDMDLLYGCLLDWGLPLSMPHSHEKIDGFTVHTYNDGDLIACFEERISEKAIREIASRKPLRAVFRDSSFSSSPEKINVFEIFKLLAPNTNVRVI
jgi:adenine-specific DNA-methyltransferase